MGECSCVTKASMLLRNVQRCPDPFRSARPEQGLCAGAMGLCMGLCALTNLRAEWLAALAS
jgi:hypothetical protein